MALLGRNFGGQKKKTGLLGISGGSSSWMEQRRKQLQESQAERDYAAEVKQQEDAEKLKKGDLGEEPKKAKFRGLNDVEVDVSKKEILETWDSFNEDARKRLAKVIRDNAAKGDRDAAWLDKWLSDSGKYDKSFWGEAQDFIEASNDKFFGGMARGLVRGVEWLMPGDQSAGADKIIEETGMEDKYHYTTGGDVGRKFGSAQKGVVDVASMVAPAGAADKAMKGVGLIQRLNQGGKAAKAAGYAARVAPGSLAASGVDMFQEAGRGNEVNVGRSAGIGLAADLALPGVGRLLKKTDKVAGKLVSGALDSGGRSQGLQQLGEDGVVGTLNKTFSRAGRKATYAASDALQKTKAGSKIVSMKDDFMTRWVSEMHPLYKALKRSDFEGKTDGAYLAAREAVGNSNRALSYANDFIENSEGFTKVSKGIEAKHPTNLVEGRKQFDEYAKVRSELDLAKAGKKKFSKKKMAELEERAAKMEDFSEEYDGLVQSYKELNDFRLENGLISKEQYDNFADEGFDYVRQQRELPDWMLEKPATKGRGSKVSITKSEAVQRRNERASAELLSPTETMIKTTQLAHVEAYRNKAAKTVYSLLEEAGEAKLIKSTDMVREKQRILKELAESKPLRNKLNRMLRSKKNAASTIQKEITQLRKKGRNELSKEIRGFIRDYNKKLGRKADAIINPKETMEMLMSIDSKELRKIRRMLESRNKKLEPIFDTIEVLNRDLDELSKMRSGLWQDAQSIRTTVDKGGMTSLSFLDDGVENVVRIDPEIASAVHNWDKQQQNVMNAFLRMTNNVFKYGTTGANVGFALPNFVADQIGSAINSKSLLATHNPRNFIHSFMMSIGKPMNATDAEILRKYLAGNKGQLNINQYTKKAASDKIANRVIRQTASRGSKAFTILKNQKEARRVLFDGMEDLVGLTENMTRIQNYRGTYLKAGKKQLDAERLANQAARENSVDFLEMGSYGRMVNSLIPYFNAGVQGSRVMLRNAAERPVSFAAKTTALVGVPVAATTIWNTSDENRAAIYATIPEYVKEGNFVVITPAARWNEDKKKWDGVYMMKKPPGFKEFAEPVRKFIEYQAANDPDKLEGLKGFLMEEGGDIVTDFANSLSPIDFSDQNKFLSSVTPQLLKPTAEAIVNRNFFTGEDIVRDNMQDLPAAEQKYENYSQLTSWIAGMFDTSPLKVDHWIRQTFGEAGTNVQHYTDRLTGAPEEAQGGRSLLETVQRRFYGPSGGADADAFYKSYNPASSARRTVSKEITSLVKQGRIREAKRKAEEFNESIIERFSKFMREQKNSPNYNPDWDEMINNLHIPTTDRAFSARKRQ